MLAETPPGVSLRELIEQARQEGKWLYSLYQGLWFSPDELATADALGLPQFGPANWTLGDPNERLVHLEKVALRAQRDANAMRTRVAFAREQQSRIEELQVELAWERKQLRSATLNIACSRWRIHEIQTHLDAALAGGGGGDSQSVSLREEK